MRSDKDIKGPAGKRYRENNTPPASSHEMRNTGWKNIGSFETVGECMKILALYDRECSLGFIHQAKQDLFFRIEKGRGMLGFQMPLTTTHNEKEQRK